MSKGKIFISMSVLTLCTTFCAISFAFDDGDFQFWTTESVTWKLDDTWKATLEEEFRLGDDGGNFYYQHSDIGVVYSGISDWFDVGLNYRHIFEEKNSTWKQENQPHINAEIKWKWFNFSLNNRGRFGYRNKEDAENYWEYRNKFTVKAPFKATKFEIQPYISDEIFYDFNEETLNKNRLSTGFAFKLFKNLSAELYYLWQSSEKDKDWTDIHALGTKIKFSF